MSLEEWNTPSLWRYPFRDVIPGEVSIFSVHD